jgi:hypothetical protein
MGQGDPGGEHQGWPNDLRPGSLTPVPRVLDHVAALHRVFSPHDRSGSIGAIKLRGRHGGTCLDCGRSRGVARPSTVGHITPATGVPQRPDAGGGAAGFGGAILRRPWSGGTRRRHERFRRDPAGQICGSILWEAKRTKNWADGWLGKVREDQRAAKADMALIVSHALPKGLQTFDQIDGVWVSELARVVDRAGGSAASWRRAADQDGIGLPVPDRPAVPAPWTPRHRIEAVVERLSDMQADLDRERKTMMRLWAKREVQIRGAGLYGDLQGIVSRRPIERRQLQSVDFQQASAGAAE